MNQRNMEKIWIKKGVGKCEKIIKGIESLP